MSRWREIYELARLRTLVFLRVPEALFWVFVFPMVLAAVLGFAFQSSGPKPNRVGVVAGDAVPTLAGDELLEIERFPDRAQADLALRNGKVDALLLPSEDGARPTLQLDPARADSAAARLRVLVALGELSEDALLDVHTVQERGARYIDFLFPGLLGMNLMGTGMWSIGFAVAELRQRKVLKRLLVTPMRRSSFLLSFLCSRLVFLTLEVAALAAFGLLVLHVPMRGGALPFALLCLLGAFTFAGVGLLAAARVRTIEGASGMLNVVMMPMWLGSGVFFTYERFPEIVHPVLRLLPLTALNDALRLSMLEGAGLPALAFPVLVLAAWATLGFVVAVRIFRWE